LFFLQDYEFFEKAGQGAFGKVLVVRHKGTRQARHISLTKRISEISIQNF
jgi:hypothetical protein